MGIIFCKPEICIATKHFLSSTKISRFVKYSFYVYYIQKFQNLNKFIAKGKNLGDH